MDAGRLLKGLNYMDGQQALDCIILQPDALVGKQVSNYAFAALIDKEGVSTHTSILHRGVTRKDFGINVAKDHLRRRTVVPGHQLSPNLGLALQQGTQVLRTEVP